MYRRAFLKALAALGASLAVPLDLVTASAAEVDVAWTAATKHIFRVNDYGTLSCANVEREWYDDALRAVCDYFREQHADVLDNLYIVIIDPAPGSSCFEAKLGMDPDEANELAERLGLGLRFIRGPRDIPLNCTMS